MVESISGGERVARLELIQNKVHPSLPLNIFALLITILQLGPDVVEVVEEFLGGAASPVDGHGEEAYQQESNDHQQIVEAGIWKGLDFSFAKSALKGPVQSTVWVGGGAFASGWDTCDGRGETIEDEHNNSNDADKSS